MKVQPGAAHSAIQGIEGEFLKVRLAAPPVDGKANEELIRLDLAMAPSAEVEGFPFGPVFSQAKVLLLEQFSEENFQRFLQRFRKGLILFSHG